MALVHNMIGGSGSDNTWKRWVEAGGLLSSSYESLEDVFKDEVAVRQLMTKHASSDFLYNWYLKEKDKNKPVTILDAIMNSEYGAKWLGLRDYVCDKFMANATAQATMLASKNWEYILKDHVPNMTSNTAPYGTIISSGHITDYYEWYAFNRDTHSGSGGDRGCWLDSSSNEWLGYNFTNPICVKKIKYKNATGEGTINIKIEASNDNSTWTEIYAKNNIEIGEEIEDGINNTNYYLYYRANLTKVSSASYIGLTFIQFYGRSLTDLIEPMTSNNGFSGVSSSTNNNANAWKAFDKNDTTDTNTTSGGSIRDVIFTLNSSIEIMGIYWYALNTHGYYCHTYLSEDGSIFTEIDSYKTLTGGGHTLHYISLDTPQTIKAIKVAIEGIQSAYNEGFAFLNIYGLDYSEREDRTYIYDHGVELKTIIHNESGYGLLLKRDDDMLIQYTSSTSGRGMGPGCENINFANYSLVRAIIGNEMTQPIFLALGTSASPASKKYNPIAVSNTLLPNNCYCDVKDVNDTWQNTLYTTSSGKIVVKEWWLE